MPVLTKSEFATNLEKIRTERGLTQSALAKAVGVDPSQVSLWENPDSKVWIGLENLNRLLQVLNIRMAHLFPAVEGQKIPEYSYPPKAKPITVREALEKLNSLGGPIVFKKRSKARVGKRTKKDKKTNENSH